MSILLIDAGNTRIKWALARAESFNLNDPWIKSGHFNHEQANQDVGHHLIHEASSIKKIIGCRWIDLQQLTTILYGIWQFIQVISCQNKTRIKSSFQYFVKVVHNIR